MTILNRFLPFDYAQGRLSALGMTVILVREVEISEFFVIFYGGFVVGFCGFDFVFEIAERNGIAIGGDFSDETLLAGVPIYTLVF